MKKIILALIIILSVVVVPSSALYAQDAEPIEVPGPSSSDIADEEDSASPDVPRTGIAPSDRLAQNAAVFAAGSAIGIGVGLGIIAVRRRLQQQEAVQDDLTDK